jgi:predicted esterase
MISAPWWGRRSAVLFFAGSALILGVITVRMLFPPSGSRFVLTTLPGQTGPRWLNRIFDEQDVVLFGARVGAQLGIMISPAEENSLFSTLYQTYGEMRSQGVTPLSPFLTTYLNQQRPSGFDAVIAEPASGISPRSGIIFLHGYGGNFTLQCWLVAQAGDRTGAMTVCPSTRPYGDWWSPQGAAILQATLRYLQQRGIERIYLAGLSNGGIGASRLAQRFQTDLAGLILISGADPQAVITDLPALVVQGRNDERIPVSLIDRYIAAAGPETTYLLLEGDHFVLLKRADPVQGAIADWLTQQEGHWGRK